MSFAEILAEDRNVISYRRRLNYITGSVTATILLQQIIHRASTNGYKPFYKFRSPCEHSLYREGDSWVEELGFTPREFDGALHRIGTKITKDVKKKEILESDDTKALVIYWTDANRVTWYQLNERLLGDILEIIYDPDWAKANLQKGKYLIIPETVNTLKSIKGQLPITEIAKEDQRTTTREFQAEKDFRDQGFSYPLLAFEFFTGLNAKLQKESKRLVVPDKEMWEMKVALGGETEDGYKTIRRAVNNFINWINSARVPANWWDNFQMSINKAGKEDLHITLRRKAVKQKSGRPPIPYNKDGKYVGKPQTGRPIPGREE